MWPHAHHGQHGAQFTYSDQAIAAMLTIKEVFHLTNRSTEGFMRSLFTLLGLRLPVAGHTTLSQPGKHLSVSLTKRAGGVLHLVMDISGLKVYGQGECYVGQYGYSKRRAWRKLHLLVDADSSEIQTAFLSEAGLDDGEMVAPALVEVEQGVASFGSDEAYQKRKVYLAV